ARPIPATHRYPRAGRHRASAAYPGAGADVLLPRGAGPGRDDRKVRDRPRLVPPPAERVRASAPPCEDGRQSLRRVLQCTGGGGARLEPGDALWLAVTRSRG